MKYLLTFILVLFVFSCMTIPNVFASENLFYGISIFEKLPTSIVPENSQIIEIKLQYQNGPYWLSDFKPIVDVNPKEAASYVHIEFEPLEGISLHSVNRIVGTITVDKEIPNKMIFLNISYVGTASRFNEPISKSGWSDSAIIDILQNDVISDELLVPNGNGMTHGGNISSDKTVYPVPWETKPPLKQSKDGIQFHNVKCNAGLELVYKNDHKTSACVILTTKIELMVRGWADDMRVITGCFGERYDMCYPSDKNEYRKTLYEYYFGDDDDLPSSNIFEFTRLHSINGCNEKPQVCLGEFDNGTKIRVACDYPIHSCLIPFDRNDYKTTEENEN